MPILFALLALAFVSSAPPAAPKLRIYVLAGQSNMEGKGHVRHIEWLKANAEPKERAIFQRVHRGGDFADVPRTYIRYKNRIGKLNVGWGSNREQIGPEYGFGLGMAEALSGDILLLKVSEGGKTLKTEFLPPSSGGPGRLYQEIVDMVKDAKSNLTRYVPSYRGQGYSIEGLVWFQGFNDNIDKQQKAEGFASYAERLDHLLHDLRRDLDAPQMKMVIGQLGFNASPSPFNKAQKSVADLRKNQSTVRYVPIHELADATVLERYKGWQEHKELWAEVGADRPYHYYGSFLHFFRFGRAFSEAMLDMTPRYTMKTVRRQLDEHTKPIHQALNGKKFVVAYRLCTELAKRVEAGEELFADDPEKAERFGEVFGFLRNELFGELDSTVAAVQAHRELGDVYRLSEVHDDTKKRYAGIDIYDAAVGDFAARVADASDRELKQAIAAGKRYYDLVERVAQRRTKGRVAALRKFAEDHPDSIYGQAAQRVINVLGGSADAKIGSAASYLRQ